MGSTSFLVEITNIFSNPGIQLFGLLVAALGLSFIANYCLSRIFYGRTYRFLIAPGVIIHEYSHVLGCLVTGARVREVRVFDERGGRVVHEPPRITGGEGIISIAPIFGAALTVYILARLLVPAFVGFGELEISSWQFLLFAYLASSITAAMAPSTQDLKVGLAGFTAICAVIGLGALSDRLSSYFSNLLGVEFERVLGVVEFSLIVLAVLAVSSGIVYIILHRTTRKGMRYRQSFE